MSRKIQLAVVGVAAYLLILVVTFPASRVIGLLESQEAGVSLAAATGSVFSGQAGQLVYQGLNLGPVRWAFRPRGLFTGKLEYRLELTHPDNRGRLVLGVNLSGDVVGHDVDLVLRPDRIINHYSPVSVRTTGSLQLVFDEFAWIDQEPHEVSGRMKWTDGAVIEPVNLTLGQIEMQVESRADELVGEVIEGGVLGASGEVALLTGGRYRVNLSMNPDNSVSPATLDVLGQAATTQTKGNYLMDFSGQF